MFNLDFITSVVGILSGLTLLFAYSRLLFSDTKVVKYLARSIFLLSFAFLTRSFYWDVVSDEVRVVLVDVIPILERSFFNALVNSMFILSAVYGSAAIHEMIPPEDRGKWSVLTAWFYPPFRKRK